MPQVTDNQAKSFDGAKAAVFIGTDLLVYLRDDRPDIPFPGHWDFPGGGREGVETPLQTLRREVAEEFGLAVPDGAILWSSQFQAVHRSDAFIWFFVVRLPASAVTDIVFGEEGQHWTLMSCEAFAALPNAVPSFAPRLAVWKAETGGLPI